MGRVPIVNENYRRVIEAARRDLHRSLVQDNNNSAPILLRLSFHDAVDYDAATKRGGANGSVRLAQELNRTPNKGIETAVRFCEPIKRRHPDITYADLYQLAGIVAVEVTGGPAIDFVPGRADADVADQDNIPNPRRGADHLRTVFYRMGLNDKDIVVLSGAHALGGAHKDRSGFDGDFTRNPLTFDNSYFVELLRGDTPGLVKFPTDKALLTDPRFRPFVDLYARDQRAFFRDYAESHKKMSLLGLNHPESNLYESNSCSDEVECGAQSYVVQNGGCPMQYGYARPYAVGNGCCPGGY
ncbi:hypothetical protein SOVF_070820 [Spinacia oleracea]|nr:hypothetical protein SOVF_070820 [Spinacia oleracea]